VDRKSALIVKSALFGFRLEPYRRKNKMTRHGAWDVCLGTQSFGGCASVDETFWHIEFMHGHQQMSLGLYQDLLSTCGVVNLRFGNYTDVPGCQPLLDSLQYQLGGYNVLSLYDQCYLYQPPQLRLASGRWLSDYPCGGEYAMAVWVDNTEVRNGETTNEEE
jgi:hypothetical protein